MDDDTRELVIQLCTKIGTRMEDAGASAIMCAGLDDGQLRLLITDLTNVIDDMRALAAAAAALADVSAAGRTR